VQHGVAGAVGGSAGWYCGGIRQRG
jgi:hypothetical protein